MKTATQGLFMALNGLTIGLSWATLQADGASGFWIALLVVGIVCAAVQYTVMLAEDRV